MIENTAEIEVLPDRSVRLRFSEPQSELILSEELWESLISSLEERRSKMKAGMRQCYLCEVWCLNSHSFSDGIFSRCEGCCEESECLRAGCGKKHGCL